MPALLPTPPKEQRKSSAPAQSANRTTSSLHPMSILSLITTDLPITPPDPKDTSSKTNHAAEAPLVPPPKPTTSPVNDSASTVNDTEALTAAEQLYSMRSRNDANERSESITAPAEDESLHSALTDSSTATVKDKGKGKDPELYDIINPPQDGNGQGCQVDDRSAPEVEAEKRLQVPAIKNETDLASVLVDLGAKPYECNTCLDGDLTLCSRCLTVPWRQRNHPNSPVSASPSSEVRYEPSLYSSDSEDQGTPLSTTRPLSSSPEVDHEPSLYSSDSEDEGAPLFTAPKIRFNPSCYGNCLQLSAHEGNAVFDLLPQRKQRHQSLHQDLKASNGEMRCRRCELVQAHIDGHYEQCCTVREYKRFERGDTVPLDDDAVDGTASEGLGAAEYDGSKYHSVISSHLPKLSRKTIRRLKAEKSAWKSDPSPLMSTPADPPVSTADVAEPTSLPRYPKRSAARSSVTTNISNDPEATPDQPATEPRPSPPPSSDTQPPHTRPTYADRRSSASYPLVSNFIDLATSTSSFPYNSPYTTRQPQQQKLKPFTPSPLKHAQSASTGSEDRASEESHGKQEQQQQHTTPPTPPTTTTTTTTMNNNDNESVPVWTQAVSTQNQRGNGKSQGPIHWFSPSPVKYIYGSLEPTKKHKDSIPLTPPSSARKRKAVEVQREGGGEVEWQGKKFKGRTVVASVEQERMRDVLFALHAVGGD